MNGYEYIGFVLSITDPKSEWLAVFLYPNGKQCLTAR